MRADAEKAALRNVHTLLERLAATDGKDSRTLDANRAAAAQALGALADVTAVPGLIQALSHPNQVCVAAALALGRISHADAVMPLVAVLEDENKFWMPRGAAAVALGQMGAVAQAAVPALTRALALDVLAPGTSWDVRAREAVEDALRHLSTPSAECLLKGQGQRYAMWGIH
jgi:HEAT repeat protein